jgi:hypothetical protein
VSYVRLKHALAEIALDVLEHPARAPLAAPLAAFGRMSRRGEPVPLAALARATGMSVGDVNRLLQKTGLFRDADGTQAVALAAPLQPFTFYLRRQTARLQEALDAVRSSVPPDGVPREIWRGRVLFNAGLFFECHEYLEDVWRAATAPERAFYHGLVQVAAACYHLEKGNRHGARTLLTKALAKLEPYAPVHLAVDVAALVADFRGVLVAVDASPTFRPRTRADLPTWRLASEPGAVRPPRGKQLSLRERRASAGRGKGRVQ